MALDTASHTPSFRLEIAESIITGIWLVALFTGQDWWLPAMLFGYIVVLPIVKLLSGERDSLDAWWEDESDGMFGSESKNEAEPPAENNRDALETLRSRYARGELTDEQFERKLEMLLDTDTLENAEDRARARKALKE